MFKVNPLQLESFERYLFKYVNKLQIQDWVSCELRGHVQMLFCKINSIDFGGHSQGMRRQKGMMATRQVSQTRTRSALGPKPHKFNQYEYCKKEHGLYSQQTRNSIQ